jgi:hypothetical protein
MTITDTNWPTDFVVIEAYLHLSDAAGPLQTITLDSDVRDDINAADSAVIIEVTFEQPDTAAAVLEFVYQDQVTLRTKSESNPLWVFSP